MHQNDLVDHATNCEIPALAGSVLECRVSPIHVWGQLDYQTRKADGDVEAGDSRSKRFTGLLGIDASVGNAAIIGGDIGYLSNHFRDHQFGDHAEGNGWTGGVYGVYDPGAFYVKALAHLQLAQRQLAAQHRLHRPRPGGDVRVASDRRPRRQDVDVRAARRRPAADGRDLGVHAVPQL